MEHELKITKTYPEKARQASVILLLAGHTQGNPYKPSGHHYLTQVIDLPGTLELFEGKLVAAWPEDGTLRVRLTNGERFEDAEIATVLEVYPEGQEIESHWVESHLEGLYDEIGKAFPREGLLARVLSHQPLGRLVLPEGTEVTFLDADDRPETCILESVETFGTGAGEEFRKPEVTYLSKGGRFTDFLHDHADEDILEILRATGHPMGVTDDQDE